MGIYLLNAVNPQNNGSNNLWFMERIARILLNFLPVLFVWGPLHLSLPFIIFFIFSSIELIRENFMEDNLELLSAIATLIGSLVLLMPADLLLSISSIIPR